MKKPVLVVMAAGMGSRYGGLKQIDPVGPNGQLIIDYSIYDARRAGFETVVFVIKHEIEETFRTAIGDRLSKVIDVRYAFQELTDLPEGYEVPAERIKPWGTCHAVLAARKIVDGPFPLNFCSRLVKYFDGANDGLVGESSFRWGDNYIFLSTDGSRGISHGDVVDQTRENIPGFDVREFYVQLVADLKRRGL